MTTWQSQYIPKGDPMDAEGWYVRTAFDASDTARMVLGVHSEDEAARLAEHLNSLVPHPKISAGSIIPELFVTFRECDEGTWEEIQPGLDIQHDRNGELACIQIEPHRWDRGQRAEAKGMASRERAALDAIRGVLHQHGLGCSSRPGHHDDVARQILAAVDDVPRRLTRKEEVIGHG